MSADKETGDLDADITSSRDTWVAKDSFNTTIVAGKTDEQLSEALERNRGVTERLKEKYADHVEAEGGIDSDPSRDRRTVFKELNRVHTANETIKNELRGRGIDYDLQASDEEHPNAAAKRIARERAEKVEAEQARQARSRRQDDCWVVTEIFGPGSPELVLAKRVCRSRFALNPLVAPSWVLYQVVGPTLARAAASNYTTRQIIRRLLAGPIANAASKSALSSLAWQAYLAIPGWATVALVLLILNGL